MIQRWKYSIPVFKPSLLSFYYFLPYSTFCSGYSLLALKRPTAASTEEKQEYYFETLLGSLFIWFLSFRTIHLNVGISPTFLHITADVTGIKVNSKSSQFYTSSLSNLDNFSMNWWKSLKIDSCICQNSETIKLLLISPLSVRFPVVSL